VLRLFIKKKYSHYHIFSLDSWTDAGNLENLTDVQGVVNYTFLKADTCNRNQICELFSECQYSNVTHSAIESHVNGSITNPFVFVETNVIGILNMLHRANPSRRNSSKQPLVWHISKDKGYVSLEEKGLFKEQTSYHPNSPYFVSKASSHDFVRAFVYMVYIT
tara:strand:+ start:1764 stop:2252 length:489 start_codon:yes stop_codon:yes gene_type:complete